MKRQLHAIFITLFAVSFAAVQMSCTNTESQTFQVVNVQPIDAAKHLAKESIVVLDVRTPEEVALGRIPGSININITGPDFEAGVAELDPSKTYMVHCAAGSVGGRSRQSIDALKSIGVMKIYHLEGGFVGWQSAGNEVEVPKK